MSKNESRQERRRQGRRENENPETRSGKRRVSKVYYWIIGILFVILLFLIIFIFSRSGDDINLEGEQDQTEIIQEEGNGSGELAENEKTAEESAASDDTEESESAANEETDESTEDQNSEEETDEDTDEDTDSEEETETDEISEGESAEVNENAPHDPNHATDYSSGSADRVEIKQRVMEVTGLGSDLIEKWVGNNGPGRVVATVSSRDQTEHYEVYLQYGDGSWHVTSYERLSSNPG